MRIRTITCHDVYNAGAGLQAYALVTYLSGLGHDAAVIDYKPDYLSRHYSLSVVGSERFDRPVLRECYLLVKLPGRLIARNSRRKRRFDAFRRCLPLTRRYDSAEALASEPPEAELYLAGSDQIWNTAFSNGRDPSFYLQFAPAGSVRASYAASFAADRADEAWADRQRAWIGSLDGIAVRERTGLAILEQLGVAGGQTVMDPVFLLDAAAWRTLAAGAQPCRPKTPYIVIYDFDGSEPLRMEAERLKKTYGLPIVSLLKCPYADADASDAGPLEFLSLIDGADYVLSNSFHATAFSLILGRQFLTFDRKEKLNSRMHDLLCTVGLDGRTRADDPIDRDDVSRRMKAEIDTSKAYLDRMLAQVHK